MPESQPAQQLAQQGIAALRAGKPEAARALLARATASDNADASMWLTLGFACARLDDGASALAAVDRALALEPYNLRALIFKGDHLSRSKRTRKALVFYQAALKVAARQSQQLPSDIKAGLQRAQASCDHFADDYQRYLTRRLAENGYRHGQGNTRFERSLDIAFGERQVYYQQPTRFYYPELPQIQFYDPAQFPWLRALEDQTEAMRAELLDVLREPDNFSPYLLSDPDVVQFNDASNVDNPDWGAYYFYQDGDRVEAHARHCPRTMQALEEAPLLRIPGNTPHALYSRLAAKTRIPPHTGLLNIRLICHLPLLVPQDCGGLRVGNQVQRWSEGQAYVFDDSIEHEAWNDSDSDRVVLLFDIWRPELSDEERELVATMLQAVNDYEGESDDHGPT